MNTTTAFANLHKTSLALAIIAVLCGTAALGADATTSGASPFTTVAHPTTLRNGDALMGALPMTQPIHIEVALKMRDHAGLDAFIAGNAKAASLGKAQQLMTSDQFLANHAPTMAQAQAVANYLTGMGYANVVIAPNRLLVSADGTAATAHNAFLTTFAQVKTRDGRIAFANTDEVRIPAALSDKILSVVGLQTVHQMHTLAQQLAPNAAHPDLVTGHNPTEFSAIYGGTGVPAAAGVIVGIMSEGYLAEAKYDLATFITNQGLPKLTIGSTNTNGTSNDTSYTYEWDLDSEDIVAMAGGQVDRIMFYDIPSLTDANVTADFNTIVASNKAKIIEMSFVECETDAQGDGSAAADDMILEAAVAQGQTFSIPAGDLGADGCDNGGQTPDWPATSQYVVAVGGTRLTATTTDWGSEVVWNRLVADRGATGGGSSYFEPAPSWQQALGLGSLRDVADLAFDADANSGAIIIANGSPSLRGGTSLSAALFAGEWARVLQKYPKIGFAGPVIYALPTADFHDITSGTNGFYYALNGYDFPTGRGSMILSKAIIDANPVSTELLQNTGFETGAAAPWVISDPAMLTNGSASAHTGNWSMRVGYTTPARAVDTLAQVVTIPATYAKATLTFYMRSDEAGQQDTEDGMEVDVYDPATKALLGQLAVIGNDQVSSTYALNTFDMTPYIGKKVNLKFIRHDNRDNNGDPIYLDDIELMAK